MIRKIRLEPPPPRLAIVALCGLLLATACAGVELKPQDSHHGGDPSTGRRALVIYGTRAGSTAEVADHIGKSLAEAGWSADVKSVRNVRDVKGYQAVIIGSGVRAGRLYSEIRGFVTAHRTELQEVPVAYFVVCMTLREDTPEGRKTADAYLDPLRAVVKPVDVGLFAGKMDPARLDSLGRVMQKVRGMPVGDFRDWKAIGDWATALAPRL